MPESSQKIEKIIQKTLAKKILNLISQNDLSISEIASKLKIDDIRSIVAYLSELHYLGLVIPVENRKRRGLTKKEEMKIRQFRENYSIDPVINWLSPLGIPIKDYQSLWEGLNKKKGLEVDHLIKNMVFTVPNSFKQRLKSEDQPNNE